ncbi:hypothetical protein V3C99_015532 [Haemonchus contortus]
MLFIFFLIPFFLVNALDNSSKSAFIQLNRQHNRKLNWNKELEQRALDYLNGKMMMITGERTYPKNDTAKLGTKVFKAFSSTIWMRRKEVAALSGASQVGCNYVSSRDSKEDLVLKYACIYIQN